MGFVWVSQFVCAACGAREATTRVEYDDLGFAVCPGCGRNGRFTDQGATRRSPVSH